MTFDLGAGRPGPQDVVLVGNGSGGRLSWHGVEGKLHHAQKVISGQTVLVKHLQHQLVFGGADAGRKEKEKK